MDFWQLSCLLCFHFCLIPPGRQTVLCLIPSHSTLLQQTTNNKLSLRCYTPGPQLSYHPNVVRFIGACCELPAGLADALAEAAAAATPTAQQQCLPAGGQRYIVPAGLARGVKLAIVMELCHLGSLFSMIGQVKV